MQGFFRFSWACVFAGLTIGGLTAATESESLEQAAAAMKRLPLRFEANQGRTDGSVRYLAHASGYTLLVTDQGPSMRFAGSKRLDLRLPGSQPARIEGVGRSATRVDSFLGNRANWRAEIPTYDRVRYRDLYPGIDMVFYGRDNQLEYDLLLAPGADAGAIRLQFHGARRVSITPEGDLAIDAAGEHIVQRRPLIYQLDPKTDTRREVGGRYTLVGRNTVALRLDPYDRTNQLVIDPIINYATYLGSPATDRISGVKLGPKGLLYVAGQTNTTEFPTTGSPFQSASAGNIDIFIAIFDTNPGAGYAIVYFSYLGGSSDDIANGMNVDPNGFVYLTGSTNSTNFPLAGVAIQSTGAVSTTDAFVTKLQPFVEGLDALWYSTYLGGTTGNDTGNSVVADDKDNIYVIGTTQSSDFPVSPGAYQAVLWNAQDTFLSKISTEDGKLAYSTYLGGENNDEGRAILLAPNGLVYFASTTLSQYFPMAGFSYNGFSIGVQDVIIGIMDMSQAGQQSLVYSTYFGGTGSDDVRGLSFDSKGNVLIAGYTLSTDLPVTGAALQTANAGNGDAYVAMFDLSQPFQSSLLYSTYLGGTGGDAAYDVEADSAGNLYVTGYTLSSNFPTTANAPQPKWGGGTNIFLTKFKPGVSGTAAISMSTYFGGTSIYVPTGLSLGPDGTMYVGGYAGGGLQTSDTATQIGYAGGVSDGFIFVIQQ